MSDQPSPPALTGAELTARLHGLAEHAATPAPNSGSGVRSRAVRRRRGRHLLLSGGALAAATLAVLTSGALDPHAAPATPATPPSPTPVQQVTVDLDAHTLTIQGRTVPIASPNPHCPIGETAVTVTGKYPVANIPPGKQDIGRWGPRRWAVTFTGRDHQQRLLLFALDAADPPSVGKDLILGAIALTPDSGKWVYDAIRLGAQVRIEGHQSERTLSDSACIDRQPVSVAR
ncbi:L,D-transpeptidase [Streptomyces sp. NPDC055897]